MCTCVYRVCDGDYLCSLQSREKEVVNGEHIERLQSTVERMLKESNQRLKTHFAEKRALMEEKVRDYREHCNVHVLQTRRQIGFVQNIIQNLYVTASSITVVQSSL